MPSSFGLWFSAYAESLIDDVVLLDNGGKDFYTMKESNKHSDNHAMVFCRVSTWPSVCLKADNLIFDVQDQDAYTSYASVDSNTTLNVAMDLDDNLLDEIVVIGYGTQ